ncbi:MAG: dehydrogenase [Planctomycetes bacterium]|nr:dehydrogenase [Planctomycetota bacterium]
MRKFRIAYTGDFLNAHGAPAYGDMGLPLLEDKSYIEHRFLTDLAPRPGDAAYWNRLYSMQIKPEHIANTDGLVVLRPWVKRSTFANSGGDLVVIGRSGAGFDKVDVAACTENDVALFNAPLALNHATASTALLFMLALAKRLHEQERIVRAGRWDLQAEVMGGELQGRTLSIVGLGHSGRELARLVTPFCMRVLAYSPHADRSSAEALGVTLTSLDEILCEADFLSLHCRLSDETRHLLGRARLAIMKPTAYLINVGRGELVDQQALTEALRDRRLAGAGLDVFAVEPLPADDPLLSLDNVILTPHWNASTTDVWKATGRAMAEGMLRAAQGLFPENVVNPEVLNRVGFQKKLANFAENVKEVQR